MTWNEKDPDVLQDLLDAKKAIEQSGCPLPAHDPAKVGLQIAPNKDLYNLGQMWVTRRVFKKLTGVEPEEFVEKHRAMHKKEWRGFDDEQQ